MVARGHAWLLGAYMVAGGHVWLPGGVHGCWGEACVVARRHVWYWGHVWWLGAMHGCWGACMVAGGHAWLLGGAWLPGHAWLLGVHGYGGGMHRIRRDTVNERAVRILLECILVSHYFTLIILYNG